MLGENTVVFTKEGFKTVKELILFDEVLTPFGDFEPIIEMGEWTEMTKKVTLSSNEVIYCSDDTLWMMAGAHKFTDELKEDEATCRVKIEMEGDTTELGYSPYDFAVVVPSYVPFAIMTGDLNIKLQFLAGLIDSPMCELGLSDGSYNLYVSRKYQTLADELLSFIRTLGLGVDRTLNNGIYKINFKVTKYIDVLPIRDEMKMCYDYASCSKNIIVKKIEDLSINDKFMGRMIKVNKGFFLIGNSLVPVC